jgi:hypothetical protein
MSEFRVLGIAVSSSRIGYTLLVNDQLIDWGVSGAAADSPRKAAAKTRELIETLRTEVVITELPGSNKRKRGKTLLLMEAVTGAAKASKATSLTTTRLHSFKDKYQEAQALAKEFPELASRLAKKPKCWLSEPRRMILFEALSFALRLRETR